MHLLLFPHQRAALKWMLAREGLQPPQPHPLAKRLETRGGQVAWADLASGEVQVRRQGRRGCSRTLGARSQPGVPALRDLRRRRPAPPPLQVEQPEDMRPSRGGMFCDEPVSLPLLAGLPLPSRPAAAPPPSVQLLDCDAAVLTAACGHSSQAARLPACLAACRAWARPSRHFL